MTELYAIPELEFVEEGTPEQPGHYWRADAIDGTHFIWPNHVSGSPFSVKCPGDYKSKRIDSLESAKAACNAHNAETIAAWLRRVPVVEFLHREAELSLAKRDAAMDRHIRMRFEFAAAKVRSIADKLARGESLIESEAHE